jgi:hypothetical protein
MGDLLVMGDTPKPPAGGLLHLFFRVVCGYVIHIYSFVTEDLNRETPVV